MRSRFPVARGLPHAAFVFAALADEVRPHIVDRPCEAGALSIPPEPRGRERIRRLEPRRLAELQGYLDRISAQWDAAIGRLRAFIERQRSEPSGCLLPRTAPAPAT